MLKCTLSLNLNPKQALWIQGQADKLKLTPEQLAFKAFSVYRDTLKASTNCEVKHQTVRNEQIAVVPRRKRRWISQKTCVKAIKDKIKTQDVITVKEIAVLTGSCNMTARKALNSLVDSGVLSFGKATTNYNTTSYIYTKK